MPHHSELVEIPGTEIELSRYSLGTAPLSGLPLPSDLWEKMEGAGLIEPILSL